MTGLDQFSEATREWFRASFGRPTDAQEGAWNAVSQGKNALVVAPTGSGKTLSAFLWSIDRLFSCPPEAAKTTVLSAALLLGATAMASAADFYVPPLVRGERIAPGAPPVQNQWIGGPRKTTAELAAPDTDESQAGGARARW